ncbi:ParB N-terminal domain-containing protein [Streptomyces mayteni]
MLLLSGQPVEEIPVVLVPVSELRLSDSPRLAGVDPEHVRVLAASESTVPPILVHRATMRVIDGAHRVHAAVHRGQQAIHARLLECGERDLFAMSVRLNAVHGLPLSLADRTAAAGRIVGSHPEWSDRAVGHVTGLSAKTVAALRRRSAGEVPAPGERVGRDGRTRPLNAAEGRLAASRLLRERPEASIREIAREADISVGTAHDVRRRLASGQDPVPPGLRPAGSRTATRRAGPPRKPPPAIAEGVSSLAKLKRDPSLRFSELGRAMLRLMDAHTLSPEARRRFAENVPTHCVKLVAAVARHCAHSWLAFAQQVEARVPPEHTGRNPGADHDT